jgi:regulator of protease activity HflC (stomatin/prohibitin superfamily)
MTDERKHDWELHLADSGAGEKPTSTDPAAQSLAKALRLSFRLLTIIMILVIVAFLLTGIKQVKANQIAIRSVFGRIIGTSRQGLTYTWPFPIGKVDLIDTSERTLVVNDFWLMETPEESTIPLAERRPRGKGLMPGYDGALLTGDGNLVHVRLRCIYSVGSGVDPETQMDQAVLFRINVNDQSSAETQRTGEPLNSEVILRSVVCRAAIRAAANRTAERIRKNPGDFLAEVERLAQAQLDELKTGMEINTINTDGVHWPLRVIPDYMQASQASHERDVRINEAVASARGELAQMAGAGADLLVGEVDDEGNLTGGVARAHQEALAEGNEVLASVLASELDAGRDTGGLIHVYTRLRDRNDPNAEIVLAEIDRVLLSNETTGRAKLVLQRASAERTELIEPVKGRLARYQELLPSYQRDPALLADQLWAQTRDRILSGATVEKFYFSPLTGTLNLEITRDPAVVRALQRRLLQDGQDDQDE